MLNLFSKLDNINLSTVYNNILDNIKDKVKMDIDKVLDYYRYRDGKVTNNNILVRLITTAAPDYNRDIYEYMRIIDNDLIYYAKLFNISSNISKGNIMENVVFHRNSLELFIFEEEDIDLLTIDENWKELIPIEVIKYDGTDTSLLVPNNKISFNRPTLSIFKIDIRKLLIQYRYWSLERVTNGFGTDPASFLYSMVFPRLVYSILDFSIINRLRLINEKVIIDDNVNKHPFHIFNLNNDIDRYLKTVIKTIKNENKTYSNIMKNIHLLNKDNMYNLLFDNYTINTYNRYAYFLSKIPYMHLLLDISNRETFKRNRDTINDLKIFIKKIERDRSMEHIDNEFVRLEFDINLNLIKYKLKDY
jgi:hypothetical protein